MLLAASTLNPERFSQPGAPGEYATVDLASQTTLVKSAQRIAFQGEIGTPPPMKRSKGGQVVRDRL